MPIIIKAKKNDSTNDVIRRFKKVLAASNIVQDIKDNRYHQKPSKKKAVKLSKTKRLKKRIKILKDMKNIPEHVVDRLSERLNT